MLAFIVFVLVLGVLVFVHELGHFLVAKKTGMRVDEFGLGFPPRLLKKKIGDTLYTINLIPLGGYVKIYGESDLELGDETAIDQPPPKNKHAFNNRPIWARIAVIVAGVSANLLFAFLALSVAFSVGFYSISQDLESIPGAKVTNTQVVLVDILPDSPAAKAGLQPSDVVTGIIDPQAKLTQAVNSIEDLQNFSTARRTAGAATLVVDIERDGVKVSKTVTVVQNDQPVLGVALQPLNRVKIPVMQAPKAAVKEIWAVVGLTWGALRDFGQKLFAHGKLDSNVSGPIGVYHATSVATKQGTASVLFLMIMLSVNLAILNILPIPALDGGKLLFLIVEAAFRRRVIKEKLENALVLAGYALLISLVLIISVRDVFRFF